MSSNHPSYIVNKNCHKTWSQFCEKQNHKMFHKIKDILKMMIIDEK